MACNSYVFYVTVPPEWGLVVDKVYIYSAIPKPEYDYMGRFFGALAYEIWKPFPSHLKPNLDHAPEFKLGEHDISNFFTQQTALTEKDAKVFRESVLVDIRELDDNEWRQDHFFKHSGNDSKARKINFLKTLCNAHGTPMFARGALYNWALMSVVGLIDENNYIKDEKVLKLEDAWAGWLKVDHNDIEKMTKLAENAPDALEIVAAAKIKNGILVNSRIIELARNEHAAEHKRLLHPKEKVLAYVAGKYLAQMDKKLQRAMQTGRVRQIGERKRTTFSQNSIYDCYQQVKDVPGSNNTKEFESGPLFVGSSFSDRTVLQHPKTRP